MAAYFVPIVKILARAIGEVFESATLICIRSASDHPPVDQVFTPLPENLQIALAPMEHFIASFQIAIVLFDKIAHAPCRQNAALAVVMAFERTHRANTRVFERFRACWLFVAQRTFVGS